MTSTDTPPETPGRRRQPRRIWRRVLIGSGIFVLVVALAAGAAVWKLSANITSKPLPTETAKDTTPQGAMNILFLGSDSRDLKTKGYGAAGEGHRSDSMMLVHIAAKNARIDAVQIPRDTVLQMPACEDTGEGSFAGGEGQINSALNYGPACSVKTVEKLAGVRIQHFVELDFDGFASMVNALGGVNVCLDKPLSDVDAKLSLPAGKQKINGKNALALARTRHAIGDGSDIGRLGHQQMVMSAIIDQARSANVLTRPDRLLRFLNALTKSMTVDDDLSSISKLTSLAKRVRSIPNSKITFVTMPWGSAPGDPNRVVPSADAPVLFDAIAKDDPMPLAGTKTTKDTSVRTSPVRVLNAARTEGIATAAETSLKGFGYTISAIATAQKQSAATRIFVDGTSEALATAKSINKDLGIKAEIVEQKITGVWLILGTDRVGATDAVAPKTVKATSQTAAASLCA